MTENEESAEERNAKGTTKESNEMFGNEGGKDMCPKFSVDENIASIAARKIKLPK